MTKVTKDAHQCACSDGCKGTTRRVFAPGHDARMVGRLSRLVADGKLTSDAAAAEVRKRGGSDLLATKVKQGGERLRMEALAKQRSAKAAQDGDGKVAPKPAAAKPAAVRNPRKTVIPSGIRKGAARK